MRINQFTLLDMKHEARKAGMLVERISNTLTPVAASRGLPLSRKRRRPDGETIACAHRQRAAHLHSRPVHGYP
jgi:hypothetical protein